MFHLQIFLKKKKKKVCAQDILRFLFLVFRGRKTQQPSSDGKCISFLIGNREREKEKCKYELMPSLNGTQDVTRGLSWSKSKDSSRRRGAAEI